MPRIPLFLAVWFAGAACASAPKPVADPCPLLVDVRGTGSYCGVETTFEPWAAADAYWEGATFQSDAGHGQSHDITITFAAPVTSVEVTAFDPTFAGNAMRAWDAKGTLVGRVEFPGNGIAGVLTKQTRTITGSISKVRLIAADGDYLNYSMRVQFGAGRAR